MKETMKTLNVPQKALVVNAKAGGTIVDACREACDLALAENCVVVLTFNMTHVFIAPGEDVQKAHDEWWRARTRFDE